MMTEACKRRGVCVSSELGDLSTVFELDESRLSKEDDVASVPTCEHQSSYEIRAESMNTRKISQCTKILRKLMDHKGGWIFNQPVDPVLYGLPDYFDVIRNPMDLGTVKKKLTSKQYANTDDFAADVRLTFSNAMKYNPPGNGIHAIAQQLNGIFDSKWESAKTIFMKACKKRKGACVSSELGDSSTVFGAEKSRVSKKDGVTPIPTCDHQSSYELTAESMNTKKIGQCTKILRELMDHKSGWIFNQPVDPVLYGIPDYFDIIRYPMDLGTVKKKLTNKQYVTTDEFAADVRLTFSNAMKYNPPGSDIHAIAQQLNGIFDSKWESVKTIFTKACQKRRGSCVSNELGDSSTVFEAEKSRISKKDGVTPIPTCEHQSSYELKAESMNTKKIRLCGNIVRTLIYCKGGRLFNRPVDPVLYGLPDYFDVIQNPMDLGTIKKKLTNKQYVSTDEFAADVRLTFSNAMKYNPPGNDVHTIAQQLNQIFDVLWNSMKLKFRGPNPVQEQKIIFTEVQALVDSKFTIGCSNSKPSVIRRPIACSNSIAKKSFKVKIISFVGSDEQISSKGVNGISSLQFCITRNKLLFLGPMKTCYCDYYCFVIFLLVFRNLEG